jgi:hypothetical protein
MVRGTPIVEVQPLEDPQPRTKRRLLSRHLSRHRIPPPEPENPAYKSIHRCVPPFPSVAKTLTCRVGTHSFTRLPIDSTSFVVLAPPKETVGMPTLPSDVPGLPPPPPRRCSRASSRPHTPRYPLATFLEST